MKWIKYGNKYKCSKCGCIYDRKQLFCPDCKEWADEFKLVFTIGEK